MSVTVHHGDSREVLKGLADASIDSVVCDPPYALVSIGKRFGKEGAAPAKVGKTGAYARASKGFMGKTWDNGETAFAVEFWAEVYRVLKPGAHVVAFSGTRTYHRMACAIEDAGFEIRDQGAWVYGSGFPKSHDVSKAIDKHLGAERKKVRVAAPKNPPNLVGGIGKGGDRPWVAKARQAGFHEAASPEAASPEAASWSGWGTALKPAWEPICIARKPLAGTVAANVLEYGTGALNISASRIGFLDAGDAEESKGKNRHADFESGARENAIYGADSRARGANGNYDPPGRWPANVVHDGSAQVVEAFPLEVEGSSAARFFYSAKADAEDRLGSKHPTVKPVDLMRWLCRLVTPPGGVILDPFAGSGTTGLAAMAEGFNAILIEREADYVADIHRRIAWAKGEGRLTAQEMARDVRPREAAGDTLPLFATHPAPPNRADGEDEVEAA